MQVKCLACSRCSKKASAIILVTGASVLSKVSGLMKDSEKRLGDLGVDRNQGSRTERVKKKH